MCHLVQDDIVPVHALETCAELALHEPFRKRHDSGILHGANGEIGDDQLIVFLERVGDPEVLLVECQTCA